MTLYILYKIGYFFAGILPLKILYSIACILADTFYLVSSRDRQAVMNNLKTILGPSYDENALAAMARDVFRNFAKYLADFFRSSKVDHDYIRRFVRIEGLDNMDKGLSKGKGVIALSAHIGNWELGGLVLSLLKSPMGAVVLTHQDKKINDFFNHQRSRGSLRPIEIGMGLRGCFDILKSNGILALLGDRDFSKNGLHVKFFGHTTLIPKGPAVFSHRIGSCIVPVFMIRQPDDTFRFVFESPIFPDGSGSEEASVKALTEKYTSVIESYVRRYPAQWYMFRNVWSDDAKDLRPDTVI